jgi:hypothetical protein
MGIRKWHKSSSRNVEKLLPLFLLCSCNRQFSSKQEFAFTIMILIGISLFLIAFLILNHKKSETHYLIQDEEFPPRCKEDCECKKSKF